MPCPCPDPSLVLHRYIAWSVLRRSLEFFDFLIVADFLLVIERELIEYMSCVEQFLGGCCLGCLCN